MRRGEAPALRWKGVDFDQCLVRVTESLAETQPTKGKATLTFKPPKSDTSRAITLPAFASKSCADISKSKRSSGLRLASAKLARRSCVSRRRPANGARKRGA
jgi:hypothetical protein